MAEPTSFKVPPGGKAGKGISKKVLGLPMWAWIAISATAILVALYLRSQQPADDATGEDEYMDDYADPNAGTYYETPLQDTPQEDVDVTDGEETPAPNKDIDININVGGKKNPCGAKPKTPAGIGLHWTCSNGKWVRAKNTAKQNQKQKAIVEANKDNAKGANKQPCGNKPNSAAGVGYHWACKNGKWQKAKNNAAQNAAQKKMIEKSKQKGSNTVRKSAPHVTVGGNMPSPTPPRTAKAAAKKPTAVVAVKKKPTAKVAAGMVNKVVKKKKK